MIEIKLNLDAFARAAENMNAAVDQVPYALSRALNDAAFVTRKKLVEQTWPGAVKQRKGSFPGSIMRIERSDKVNLTTSIYDSSGNRGHLFEHAYGGTKRPIRQHLSIPNAAWVK